MIDTVPANQYQPCSAALGHVFRVVLITPARRNCQVAIGDHYLAAEYCYLLASLVLQQFTFAR